MLPISPLRYPGSKLRLASYVEQALVLNNLRPSLYVEPFVGGASVALHLLQKGLIDKAVLIDKDPWVASFWRTVFFDTEWLLERIQSAQVTIEVWNQLKTSNPEDRREQAWTCFFLNRTSFSGILAKGAGPLGGQQQQSAYPIDCRFPRETLAARIREIAQFQERISAVWCCSWDESLDRIRLGQQDGKFPMDRLFYYFDPPFFNKAEALYRFFFVDEDHRRLRDVLLEMEQNWVLSYDSADQVEALYGAALGSIVNANGNGTKKHHIELLYSAATTQGRKLGKEVILSNMGVLPEFGQTG